MARVWYGTFRGRARDRSGGRRRGSVYILARGTVEVLRTDGPLTTVIAKLQDGDYFGEMALLSDQPRDLFGRLLNSEPELRERVQKAAASRGGR